MFTAGVAATNQIRCHPLRCHDSQEHAARLSAACVSALIHRPCLGDAKNGMDSDIKRCIKESGSHGDPPPVDVELLEGAPRLAWSDFKHPKLRQHPKNGSTVKWLAHLGDGVDGIVYKAIIGDGNKTVAVKIVSLASS